MSCGGATSWSWGLTAIARCAGAVLVLAVPWHAVLGWGAVLVLALVLVVAALHARRTASERARRLLILAAGAGALLAWCQLQRSWRLGAAPGQSTAYLVPFGLPFCCRPGWQWSGSVPP